MPVSATHTWSVRRIALFAAIGVTGWADVHAAGDVETSVLRASKVYVSPDAPPIEDGIVVVRGDRIAAVGARSAVSIPEGARESPCGGGILAAGFQNSHVHFTQDVWNDASRQPAPELSRHLGALFGRYGYTTVFDLASDRDNTLALRARIEAGEVRGPRILTAGLPLFPPNGLPIYLAHFPPALLKRMPQPAAAATGVAEVRANLDAGSEATKLFVATPQGRGVIKRMPAEIARAAAQESHRRGRMVFAHPTDIDGVRAALAAGVDVLAHTTLGVETPWPDDLRRQVVAAGMAVIPTLKLMGYELGKEQVPGPIAQRLVAASVEHVRAFASAGGELLFGTDAGYMTDHDPAQEYVLMAKAGLTPMQILASLTTTPAARWKEGERRGRLAAGMQADIVVLDADPAADPANFAKVRCTIRGGAAIHMSPGLDRVASERR
jgi:imidazolonepropionase-like amidohydrolase